MLASQSSLFFNDTATTEIYTLSLHDALPICRPGDHALDVAVEVSHRRIDLAERDPHHRSSAYRASRADRKSTRLNSSHANISYAVFCLKKIRKFLLVHEASQKFPMFLPFLSK